MKTPEQIADEAMEAFTLSESEQFEDETSDVEECSADYIREQIAAAVRTDRAQSERDGTVHAAAIEALKDRADLDHDEAEGYDYRQRAIDWIANYPDEFWDSYAGPMLDQIEADARSGDLYAGQPDPEGEE